MTHHEPMTNTLLAPQPTELLSDCSKVHEGNLVQMTMDFLGSRYDVAGVVQVDSAGTVWVGRLIIGMMTRSGLNPNHLLRSIKVLTNPSVAL